jgi:hypothetical protein
MAGLYGFANRHDCAKPNVVACYIDRTDVSRREEAPWQVRQRKQLGANRSQISQDVDPALESDNKGRPERHRRISRAPNITHLMNGSELNSSS